MESSSQLRESFLGTKSSNCSSDSNRASACSLFNVIEADYLQSWDNQETSGEDGVSNGHTTSNGTEHEVYGMYGTFEEELDLESVESLRKRLCSALGKDHNIRDRSCRLLCPVDLVRKISADVVRMSHLEPHGVEGGCLKVQLSFDGCDTELCQLKGNDKSDSLYEIILTLKEDERRWPDLKQLSLMLPNIICCKLSHHRQTLVYIGQGYKLEKVKHYSKPEHQLYQKH